MAYRIHGTLLPTGELRDVFVVDGRFTFDGVEGAETLLTDAVLLPGLVDVHAHLALASPAPPGATTREAAEASAAAHLDAGVLLVREPGGPDRSATGIGPAQGHPRVLTAGRFLAPPGMYFPGLAREVTDDGLPDAAAEELAAGTGWAKVIGDTPLSSSGPVRTYSRDALMAVAERVHGVVGRIAIHCMEAEVIQDAIEAGFDSIEHGTAFLPEQMAAAAAGTAAWVPTLSIEEGIHGMTRDLGYPDAAIAHVDEMLDRQPASLQAAVEAGVTVLAGSWTARTFLGLPGIEEGAPADLVAFREDPREDLSVLATPALTILDGRLVRDPR